MPAGSQIREENSSSSGWSDAGVPIPILAVAVILISLSNQGGDLLWWLGLAVGVVGVVFSIIACGNILKAQTGKYLVFIPLAASVYFIIRAITAWS